MRKKKHEKLTPAAYSLSHYQLFPKQIQTARAIRWMEEILHQLIGGLSMSIPLFIYLFTGFQHVSAIQGGAGFRPSTVCPSRKGDDLRSFVLDHQKDCQTGKTHL